MPPSSQRAEPSADRVRRARPLLGTIVDIAVAADRSSAELHGAIDAAFAVVERVHVLMSYHESASDLSRLNRMAAHAPCEVDAHTAQVLEAALHMARLSEGAFDPCIAPHLEARGLLPRRELPTDRSASWRDVEVQGLHVRFKRPLRIDLGGIAKGYAVDRAVATLRDFGARNIVVNAGGDLRVDGDQPQCVQLRHPLSPAHLAHTVTLQNAALATSASYFSSALVDPRRGEPYPDKCSVSVRASSCVIADALTKVVMFAAPALAARVLEACDADAYVLQADPACEPASPSASLTA